MHNCSEACTAEIRLDGVAVEDTDHGACEVGGIRNGGPDGKEDAIKSVPYSALNPHGHHRFPMRSRHFLGVLMNHQMGIRRPIEHNIDP